MEAAGNVTTPIIDTDPPQLGKVRIIFKRILLFILHAVKIATQCGCHAYLSSRPVTHTCRPLQRLARTAHSRQKERSRTHKRHNHALGSTMVP
jgi:hypothetical protein